MLSDREVETLLDRIQKRVDEINYLYVTKVGEQIKRIGELSPSSIHKLIQMQKAGTNVAEINRRLRRAAELSAVDVEKIYEKALSSMIEDYGFEAVATNTLLPPLVENSAMRRLLEAYSRQTLDTLLNFSNTTNISEKYQELVSDAIIASTNGVTDYKSAMRSAMREAATEGLRVTYESGHTRRLDTAIRMNVVDGIKHVQQEAQLIIGEQIGADGIELTAHPNSAPDHEPCQGRQFTLAEFERMQSGQSFRDDDGKFYAGFRRPIGEWNCNHFAFAIIIGVSRRIHSDAQLKEWAARNNEGCEIDGKHYSIYEASQLMRQIETSIRRQKDVGNMARAAGDDVLRRQAQKKILDYNRAYHRVAEASGLSPKLNRTYVDGFKDAKLLPADAKNGRIRTIRDAEKRPSSQRNPVTQEQIDGLVSNEFSGVRFSMHPTYNARIRTDGKTTYETYAWGQFKRLVAVEIGQQTGKSREFLMDTIVHEELEARIASRNYARYERLRRASEKDRHEYIDRAIQTYFRLKGWDYDMARR